MKKILTAVIFFVLGIEALALSVTFKTQSFDGETYLIMQTDYDDDKVVEFPIIIKFYLNDGTTFKLESDHSVFRLSTNLFRLSKFCYRFKVTPQMMDAFSKGIKGFVINTLPEIYKETYNEAENRELMDKLTNPKETDILDF